MRKRFWKHFARRSVTFLILIVIGIAIVAGLYIHDAGERGEELTLEEAVTCVIERC